MTRLEQASNVYAAQGKVIQLCCLYPDNLPLRRVLYRLDGRMYELSPLTSPKPRERAKLTLNELYEKRLAEGIRK